MPIVCAVAKVDAVMIVDAVLEARFITDGKAGKPLMVDAVKELIEA